MLNLFKKDAKVDPKELDKLRQKLTEVTSQPIPAQPPVQPAQSLPVQPPFQTQQNQPQQYTYVDPEKAEDNERITNLIMQQIKELIEIDSNLNTKIKEIETKLGDNTNAVNSMKSSFDSHKVKMEVIDKNMEKFMGLYEIVTNRFNPFIVEEDDVPKPPPGQIPVSDIQPERKELPATPYTAPIEKKEQPNPVIEDRLEKQLATEKPNLPDMKEHMSQLASEVSQVVNSEMRLAIAGLSSTITAQVNTAVKEQVEKGAAIKALVRNAVAEELGKTAEDEPKRLKKVPKTYHFHLPNGFLVDSRQSLIDGLKSMADSDFTKYVDETKNDFAQWIALALKEAQLALQANRIRSRAEIIEFCERSL